MVREKNVLSEVVDRSLDMEIVVGVSHVVLLEVVLLPVEGLGGLSGVVDY